MQKVYLRSSFTKCNENCGLPDLSTDYQIRHLGNPSGLPEILPKIDPWHLILLFHYPAFSPICHSRSYNSLIDCMLELDGYFVSQMSEMTHVTSLHLFQASRNLFLQSVVDPPSASNIKCCS